MRTKLIFYLITLNLLFFESKFQSQVCPQISTYFGEIQSDEFKGICKDLSGNIYAVGNTYNTNLPVTSGAFQTTSKGSYESFIVKFDSCGSLKWCTYFGTSGFDTAERIEFSKDSSIVITGHTDGLDLDTTYNCFQPTNNGGNDCFLAKFDLNGQARWVTYFGGTQSDFSFALTIDKNENIIIGGTTLSPTLYPTAQSFQTNLAGAVDAFLVKFNKHGSFKFSTLYGGTNAEDTHNIAVDKDGNIVFIGGSFSNNLNTSSGCFQPSSNGGMDAYVLKLDSVGNRLFSTYIGGSGLDDAYGVTIDEQKNIYITGHTSSSDFTTTAVSFQSTLTGSADNYCLKLTASGQVMWSTLFGGTAFDNNVGSKMDANNEIVTLVYTQSTDYPMVGASTYSVNKGANDFVLVKISSNGIVNWSTYLGGSGNEIASDLLLLNKKIMVCGSSASADFPVLPNNYQIMNKGQEDAVLSTIAANVLIVNTFVNSLNNNNFCRNAIKRNGNYMQINCYETERVIVYDIMGQFIEEGVVEDNKVQLNKIEIEKLYLVVGIDKLGRVLFREKIIKSRY